MTMERATRCFAALDYAIARVAEREFAKLCTGLQNEEAATRVAGACLELKKLQRSDGEPPDYDNPWVALLYILWYQPGQTYLAYKIMCQMANYRVSPLLHVVDIGCGAIATEIALRIATATGGVGVAGIPLQQSVVHSIDRSSEMIRLGAQIADELCSNPAVAALHDHQICRRNVVDLNLANLGARGSNEDWWLTALHAVYDNNVQEIRSQVAEISDRVSPVRGIATTHSSKSYLLSEACGLGASQAQAFPRSPIVDIRFLPALSQVCQIRASIHQVVDTALGQPSGAGSLRLAANYLKRHPTWFQSVANTFYVGHLWTDQR